MVDNHKYNTDLAKRQIEINEWTYNNKMDTLFVFQLVFLTLLTISIVFGLKRYGMLGSAFAWYVSVLIIFLAVVLIINRAYYTRVLRDQRQWNQRRFAEDGTKPGSPAGLAEYIASLPPIAKKSGSAECACPPPAAPAQ